MMSSVSASSTESSTNNAVELSNILTVDKTHIDLTKDDPPQNKTKDQLNAPLQLPLVFYQTSTQLPYNAIKKSNVLNPMPLKFAPIAPAPPKTANKVDDNILISNPQQPIVLQKTNNLQLPKISGAYITLLKPITKNEVQNNTGKNIIINNPSTASQKIVIAPMPKVTTNRLPTTATTNSVQPKIAIKSMSTLNNPKSSVLNFKIEDGQILSNNAPITIMCDPEEKDKLLCEEVIDLDSPEREDVVKLPRGMFSDISKQHLGISILKKQYQLPERRRNSLPLTPSVNFISDTTNQVNVTKPSTGTTETIILSDPNKVTKKHNRRKSAFSNVKTDDSIQFFDNITMDIKKSLQNTDVSLTCLDESEVIVPKSEPDYVEIKIIEEEQVKTENNEPDFKNLLKWDGTVGKLPGSSLSFVINEYGLLEYVTKEDVQRMNETKVKKENEDLKCIVCGCFGLRSDFVTSKYCSIDCQDSIKPKRKDLSYNRKQKAPDSSDESSVDNIDKLNPPWISKKNIFSWPKYLSHVNAIAAPLKLFKDPFPYNRNGFRFGMKLEGIDPLHPSYFCVLSVVQTRGYRVKLHFDGYSSNYDFWVNADSMNIFPVGWCEKHGHLLHPPPGYSQKSFNWFSYLKKTGSTAAPKHLFLHKGPSVCPNGFRIGQKLEAVDRTNTSLICVATIRDVMDNRILIHFDGWDDIYDYWVDPSSPYIHPVGWSDQYGHMLTPPSDYPNPKEFTWKGYLKEKNSTAAPVRAFKQRASCGFKKGMRLECVDKRVPQFIRVATVAEVRGHQIKIQFDGWLDKYCYWVEDDSTDIHPVTWCQKTGHPLEPPLTPEDVYDFIDCPTIGCKGYGHVDGANSSTHSLVKDCPYTDENLSLDRTLPDRLLPDSEIPAVVPVSRKPKQKKKCSLQAKIKEEFYDDVKKISIKKEILESEDSYEEVNEDKVVDMLIQWQMTPAEKETWPKHSEFLNAYTKFTSSPTGWSPSEVAQFIETLPTGRNYADIFEDNEIDGEALLLLSQKDIIDLLNIKVGPAIKLYNSIVLLRKKVASTFS